MKGKLRSVRWGRERIANIAEEVQSLSQQDAGLRGPGKSLLLLL